MQERLRGPVVEVGDERTVETQYGGRELVEVTVRLDGEPTTVTLWGDWAETAEYLEPGMELLVTDSDETEFRGERGYATSGDSMVVVEPGYLVDVTDVRSWVQCPRLQYLNSLSGIPLNYPVVKGTVVHEVFGDLLRGRSLDESVEDRVEEIGLDLGLLGRTAEELAGDVYENASAIEGWLQQGKLTDEDEWRSERTLISPQFGLKGRADAIRRGMPVELKTGKNTRRDPRFHDKVQAACYALILEDRGVSVDTGTLLYTKNAALDRSETGGDLSPAKEFSIGGGLLAFVLRARNRLAGMAVAGEVPTGYEADADCSRCFERETCQVVSGRLDQESKVEAIGRPLPEDELAYFDELSAAIAAERRETHREYAKLWRQTPAERADDDRALIDLSPIGQERRESGRWELRAERPGDAVSKIREGDVVLASDGDPIEGDAELARVERLDPEVVVTTDEPVELRRIDVYPSELSTDRMLTAVHDALLKGDPDTKDVLFDRRSPAFSGERGTYVDNNDGQNEAVNLALRADDCALIQGPPGTGKTFTIGRVVRELVARGDRVLLSAFTNRAVDNALATVREGWDEPAGPDAGSPPRSADESIVRLGRERSVREDVRDLRLPRRGDPDELSARFRDASVVAATTAACGSRRLREAEFDVAVIDEAGQLTEPSTLAAVALADRVVLVGDHQQLPPVVRSAGDLSTSLFERLIEQHPEAGIMLDRQYRMAQRIQAFPSREFYDGRLRPATGEVAAQSIGDLDGVDPDALSDRLRDTVAFLDCDGDEADHTDAEEVAEIADAIDAYLAAGVEPDDIGVIAPYRAQVASIERSVPDSVTVDTVDRFQGSSEEVILVSFVESSSLDGPIFDDHRRINVGLTRAKKALVLVGTADALRTEERYARMVEWATSTS